MIDDKVQDIANPQSTTGNIQPPSYPPQETTTGPSRAEGMFGLSVEAPPNAETAATAETIKQTEAPPTTETQTAPVVEAETTPEMKKTIETPKSQVPTSELKPIPITPPPQEMTTQADVVDLRTGNEETHKLDTEDSTTSWADKEEEEFITKVGEHHAGQHPK